MEGSVRSVILVPRRAGIPERDAAWAWCRARWRALHPDLGLYEGEHDDGGPFNRAAALNAAARLADADGRWDLAVVIDADVFIDPANVTSAIARATETGKVTWAFTRWNGLTPAATDTVLKATPEIVGKWGVDPGAIEKTNPISWSCCFVVPRAVWDEIGGFDERFKGWGWEDMAFQSVVCGIYGHERLDGDVYHLWHPRAEERIRKGTPLHPAYVANRMLGRRYMYDLRRRGLHDRAVPSTPEDMEQDRQNILRLTAAEELDSQGRPKPGMPDWRGWWPTLEELRDAARERRRPGPAPTLAIVMRSGGTLASWPARREYLERSLASLDEHVHYERVVARVIFNDWPAEVRDELDAIAARHGFYVVGEGNRGFTPAMLNLWRYLRTRTWSFDYALLTEDDFRFERDVELDKMIGALRDHPELVQVALLRDAFYAAERERGGILGHPLDEFDQVDGNGSGSWLEHRRFFTLNPTVVRRSIFDAAWPNTEHSEAVFGRQLFADRTRRSALWGTGDAWVSHLGEVRAGAGY
jgi:hypothetical protein